MQERAIGAVDSTCIVLLGIYSGVSLIIKFGWDFTKLVMCVSLCNFINYVEFIECLQLWTGQDGWLCYSTLLWLVAESMYYGLLAFCFSLHIHLYTALQKLDTRFVGHINFNSDWFSEFFCCWIVWHLLQSALLLHTLCRLLHCVGKSESRFIIKCFCLHYSPDLQQIWKFDFLW